MKIAETSSEQLFEEKIFYNLKRLAQNYAFEELIQEGLILKENLEDFILNHGKEISQEVAQILEDSNNEIEQEELNEKVLIFCREVAQKEQDVEAA